MDTRFVSKYDENITGNKRDSGGICVLRDHTGLADLRD